MKKNTAKFKGNNDKNDRHNIVFDEMRATEENLLFDLIGI